MRGTLSVPGTGAYCGIGPAQVDCGHRPASDGLQPAEIILLMKGPAPTSNLALHRQAKSFILYSTRFHESSFIDCSAAVKLAGNRSDMRNRKDAKKEGKSDAHAIDSSTPRSPK